MNSNEHSTWVMAFIVIAIIALSLIDAWKTNTRVRRGLTPQAECEMDGGRWYEIIDQCG